GRDFTLLPRRDQQVHQPTVPCLRRARLRPGGRHVHRRPGSQGLALRRLRLPPGYWPRPGSGAVIDAVARDMSPAYLLAVPTHVPWAVIVFDHFQVIKLFSEKLSPWRRAWYRQAAAGDQEVLKGARWLLLKNPEDLGPARDAWARLEKALRLNQPLATASYLK